jgi:P4 family phage/plasmid primase-like protien
MNRDISTKQPTSGQAAITSSSEFEIDALAVAEHIEMIHRLAEPLKGQGILVLATFGENPELIDGRTNRPGHPLPPKVAHFQIGDVDAHIAAVRKLAREPHRNIYMPLVVMRPDLPAGQKGGEIDIVAQLGLVADFDDADAARYAARLPLPPNHVLETSSGRFQAFYLFDQPAEPGTVKRVAEQLKAQAGCDAGTTDLSHVWRVAGCVNWPNGKKVHQDGRSPRPQAVRVVVPWNGMPTSVTALAGAISGDPPNLDGHLAGEEVVVADDGRRRAVHTGHDADEVRHVIAGLKGPLRRMIVDPTIGDRSRAIFIVISTLVRQGVSDATIMAVFRANPQGIGEKHANRSDLPEEIARIRGKVTTARDPDDPEVRYLEIGSDVEIANGVMRDLTEAHGSIVHADGGFWRYGATQWELIQDIELRLLVHAYDGAMTRTASGKGRTIIKLSRGHIDSVINEMAAIAAVPNFFADIPVGINCASGFIQIDTDGSPTLSPHAPALRQRHTLPGLWPLPDSKVDGRSTSLLVRLLAGCFGDDEDREQKINLVAEIAGAAALGYGTRLIKPKAVILKGETAENGKSQLLDVIRGLLPESAISALPPGRFGDERFVIHLLGKLLNTSDELTSSTAIASDSFKLIVTGEPVTARDVYRPAISFRPVAQHIFATNTLPSFRGGMDRGVERRLMIITFNRTIPEDERVEHIGRRVALEEADLLLDWAVEGAARLVRQRRFTEPRSSGDALREWLLGSDPVLAWLEAPGRVRVGVDRPKVRSKDAYAVFEAWAVEEGFDGDKLPAINTFVQRVVDAERGIERHRDRGGRYLIGLDLDPVD